MKNYILFIFCAFLVSCSEDLEETKETLQSSLEGKDFVIDNVIACAASGKNESKVSIFLYPRPRAINIQCYATPTETHDKNNYRNYTKIKSSLSNVFNGYLMKFDIDFDSEKWVIVTFEEEGKTHLCNPIRLKQFTKPTEYLTDNVTIDASTQMPSFTWEDGSLLDTKIYFQVVSSAENNLLSGTYTFNNHFIYYNLDNVVLNVTRDNPPELNNNTNYNFTLMGVSEDNWVNLFSEKPFTTQF
ncbi:hypothetical protein CLV91_1264 [Maribacter vaceletii]|uniref:Uncharacterized protein n=1 Tax=Maribacter vaceletii TaxID=1206816 RepID=A0A495EE83_9FLAO|nr:hypothetical protein [Maribacter vaceletii]RKR15182.1 hypothetical protein CLV91_1264 [Maribacter vaceletii]